MDNKIKNLIEKKLLKKRPEVKVGDTVKLHIRIKEGSKERVQVFEGIVLALSGKGVDQTITVRKISYGVGVEKIMPLHSPSIDKIEVIKRGRVRKSKIYYMRGRIGKKALKVGDVQDVYMTDEVEEVVQPQTEEVKETKATEAEVEAPKQEDTQK